MAVRLARLLADLAVLRQGQRLADPTAFHREQPWGLWDL
jgi:hypothetical protein